jgi:hypothetical protein
MVQVFGNKLIIIDQFIFKIQIIFIFNKRMQPPEFSLPSPFKCEGYWDPLSKSGKGYQPLPSSYLWVDKSNWLLKLEAIENYLKSLPVTMKDDKYHLGYVSYRGLSPSRLVKNEYVGNGEYYDRDYDNMCWPDGYRSHYIQEYNVMPTQRFYEYVNTRYQQLFRK